MSYLKKYGQKLFLALLEIILLLFLLTIPYYFNLISDQTYSLLKIIIVLTSISFNSYLLGKEATKKGYLEGVKYGLLLILIIFLLNTIIGKLQLKSEETFF